MLSWAARCEDRPLMERFDRAATALTLLDGLEEKAPRRVAFAHGVLRGLRKADTSTFDELWTTRFGDQPTWLTVSDPVVDSVAHWLRLSFASWEQSQSFLTEHPEILTADGAA